MSEIPQILKKRIKDCKYTQHQFAEKIGLPYDTLTDYLSGKSRFDYEWIVVFAEALECSTDYLLGRSLSPNPEYHEVTEKLKFSTETLERLEWISEDELSRSMFEQFVMDEDLLDDFGMYMATPKPFVEGFRGLADAIGENMPKPVGLFTKKEKQPDFDKQMLVYIVTDLDRIKRNLSPELLEYFQEKSGMKIKDAFEKMTDAISTMPNDL